MVEVSSSILSVNRGEESKTFFALEKAKTDYFHIDVMDGKFVKQDTYKKMIEYSNYIRRISNLPLDVHLMVEDVETGIEVFSANEPNIITFHLEACKNEEEVMKNIELIKEKGARVGIAIKPDTPGFSTFDISEIESKDLDKYFKEFKQYISDCEFIGCTHIKEENCGVKQAVENEKISKDRYNRFCKIYEELKEKEKRKKW